jgi:hypothetical protein
MSVIARSNNLNDHRPPEFIERKVCGECGIVPPFCDHDRAKLVVERYVPEQQIRGAVKALGGIVQAAIKYGVNDQVGEAIAHAEVVMGTRHHPQGGQ